MATTKKAQIVREDAEGKKKTATFNHVSAAADDTAIGECLDLYGGLMEGTVVEKRVQETRVIV